MAKNKYGHTQSIELDCAPGTPRPDTYIGGVIAGTGLEVREPASTFFGNWEWNYSDVDADTWEKIRPTLETRVKELYYEGCIRYGSW